LIIQARQQALRSVDTIQVQTYWQIGRHIIEFEQGRQARAAYGKRLIAELATALTTEFGKGYTKMLFNRILTAFLDRYRFDLPDSIAEITEATEQP
jgi:hypothetical protein